MAVLLPQISYGLPFWQPTALQRAALNTLIARPLLRVLHLPFNTHRLTLLFECGCPDLQAFFDRCVLRYVRRLLDLPAGHPSRELYAAQVARHSKESAAPGQRILPTLATIAAEVRGRLQPQAAARLSGRFSPVELHHVMTQHQAVAAEAEGWCRDYYQSIIQRDKLQYPATYLLSDPHTAASVRARLRLNRNNLAHSLFRRGLVPSALCSACGRPETLAHIAHECAAGPWAAARVPRFSPQQLLGVGDANDHVSSERFRGMLAATAPALLALNALHRI